MNSTLNKGKKNKLINMTRFKRLIFFWNYKQLFLLISRSARLLL